MKSRGDDHLYLGKESTDEGNADHCQAEFAAIRVAPAVWEGLIVVRLHRIVKHHHGHTGPQKRKAQKHQTAASDCASKSRIKGIAKDALPMI